MLLRKTPIVPLLLIVSLTLLLGFFLPVIGIILLIFLLYDLIRYQLTKGKNASRDKVRLIKKPF